MTEITFHIGVAQVQSFVQRLLPKIWAKNLRPALCAPDAFLQELSAALWAQSPSAFPAHCFATDTPRMQAAGQLVLTANSEDLVRVHPSCTVLILLAQSGEPPSGFERFERVVEVVSDNLGEREAARKRWAYYKRRGYALSLHESKKLN